jgi:hypothetical protein
VTTMLHGDEMGESEDAVNSQASDGSKKEGNDLVIGSGDGNASSSTGSTRSSKHINEGHSNTNGMAALVKSAASEAFREGISSFRAEMKKERQEKEETGEVSPLAVARFFQRSDSAKKLAELPRREAGGEGMLKNMTKVQDQVRAHWNVKKQHDHRSG